MKKLLLSLTFLITASVWTYGQVVFIVLAPSEIEGGYTNFTYAEPGTWGVADLTDPANSVEDTLALADDGTTADSLSCDPLVNSLAGKIALLYRGTCEFGDKAKNAQDAGARAVVIINNQPANPIPMGAGAFGADVTIPVVLIDQVSGALLRAKVDEGVPVNVFIGSNIGFFENDLGFSGKNTLKPNSTMVPSLIAQNAAEYGVELGAWIFNYGQNAQTDITLTVDAVLNGTNVFTQTSTPITTPLNSGDSVYIAMPTFSLPTYDPGYYSITYTANSGAEDFDNNNTVNNNVLIDDRFAVAAVDETGDPITTGGIQPGSSGESTVFKPCIVFRDANASRLIAKGMSFFTLTAALGDLTGEFVEVSAIQWDDEFTGLSDEAFDVANITVLASAIYDYTANDQGILETVDFEDPFVMEDNQRYLFCVTSTGATKFVGFDSNINYDLNEAETDQPVWMNNIDDAWSLGFTGTPTYPAIILNTVSASGVNEYAKNEISGYPNPANDVITIPMTGFSGAGSLTVMDIAGKTVLNENILLNTDGKLRVNVANLSNGIYNFNITFENGKTSSFKVAVSK